MGFLYDLLQERTPEMNISHKKMPSWEGHIAFWDKCDYKEAYVIMEYQKQFGLIYLTKKNEVGIFIKQDSRFQGIGSKALHILLDKHKGKRILANLSPKNEDSRDFFLKHGFKHIQNTYECVME